MNRNAYLQKCFDDLSKERALAQSQAYSNFLRAKKDPDFSSLDRVEKELVFQLGKLRSIGKRNKELEEQLKETIEKKKIALEKLGMTISDLEPKYSCKICNDVGYVGSTLCDCMQKRLNKLLIESCGFSKDKLFDFKDFDEKLISDSRQLTQLKKLKKKFEDLANTYPENSPKFIVLCGKTGVGKTFITECLAKALLEKNFLVSFISAYGMNNLFLNYHTSMIDQKQSYINALIDPDVLVIDDLGTEPLLKNVTKEYLLVVLSERSRLNKLTIVTTNLEPQDILARYNERVFSRLLNKRESFLAQIVGNDLRINN